MRSRPLRLAAVLAATAALVLGVALPASAHVRVDGPGATQGGYAVLTFRVPTESATASTVGLTVTFPKATPLASVLTQPKAGWSAKVDTAKLDTPITTDDGKITDYVTQVTWTATGAGIAPGEFDTFAVSAGPLPDTATLTLPALQTYSDGSTVNWNEESTGGTEPEHPAPTLSLAAAASSAGAHGMTASATPMAMASDSSSSDGSALALGGTGLGLGVLALVVAIVALVRANRGAGRGAPDAREGAGAAGTAQSSE